MGDSVTDFFAGVEAADEHRDTHMNVAQHILVGLFDKLLPRRVITNVIGTP